MTASDAQRAYLREVLGAAPPSYLARVILDIEEGRIAAIYIGSPGEEERITAEDLAAAARKELDKRLERSRRHAGRGT
jgi:hypothetical protein